MERSLVWSALAIGIASWLAAFALTRTKRFAFDRLNTAVPQVFLTAAAALPILLFLITLPSHGRLFSPGHDLGNGFLVGALGALLSSALLIQNLLAAPAERSHLRTAAVSACPFGLAVSCTAALLLARYDTLYVALVGAAIGWLATSTILLLGLMHGGRSGDTNRPEPLIIIAGASFATLLCATVVLGDYHGEVTFLKTSTSLSWGVLALACAAVIPLFVLLSAAADLIFNPEPDFRSKSKPAAAAQIEAAGLRARVARAAIVLGGVGVLGRLLSSRVIDVDTADVSHALIVFAGPSRLFQVFSIGLVVGLLLWWIAAAMQSRDELSGDSGSSSRAFHPWQNSALGVLIVLAAAMAAFQMLAGFGVGLMLIGMFPAIGLALLSANEAGGRGDLQGVFVQRTECALRVVQLAATGAILALFRVYTTVNDGLFPHSPYTDQYAAFGFVAGAALPLFLAGYLAPKQDGNAQSGPSDAASTLGRLFVSGALILAVPSFILILWGQKCIMAFLVALAITAAGIGSPSDAGSSTLAGGIRKLFPAIYALGLTLALCEWSHYVLDTEDWTRVQKERVIVQIVGAAILLVLGMDYGPRIAARIKRDRNSGSTPNSLRNGAAR